MNPLALLKEGIRAVPAVRYALGVVGVSAAIFIVRGLLPDVSIVAMLPLLIGAIVAMAMLAIFAAAITSPLRQRSTIGMVFLWGTCIFTMVFMLFTVTAVAVGWPAAWAKLILPEGAAETSLVNAANSGANSPENQTAAQDEDVRTDAIEQHPKDSLPEVDQKRRKHTAGPLREAQESEAKALPGKPRTSPPNTKVSLPVQPTERVKPNPELGPLNISGRWLEEEGNEFRIEQIDENISFRVFKGGQQIGRGKGNIYDRVIHQTYFFEGGQMECPARLEPSNKVINGVCYPDDGIRRFRLTRASD